jgi:SpoVK/Ycf46/Vps4 family AAA+-type ATPase
MATKEAVAQLAALPERVGVLESKVENINEKLIDLKADVKEMHDCLDNTRDLLDKKLCEMSEVSSKQHDEIFDKIAGLEKVKSKVTMYAMAGLAFAAGAGWINTMNLPHLLKFLGL